MELIIAAIVGGVLLAAVLWKVIVLVVGPAVDSLITWAILNFGNEEAVRRLHQRRSDE